MPQNCPFPFDDNYSHLIHPSLDWPHSPSQTASGYNQPFCHNTLSGQTYGDRHTDQLTDGIDDSSIPWALALAILIESDMLTIFKLQAACAFRFMCKHIELWVLPWVSLKVIGNHSSWLAIHDFLLVFHCNYILHRFQDIIDYFAKFKESHVTVTTLTGGTICQSEGKYFTGPISVQNLKSLA